MPSIYGKTPYAGVKPISGERPVLVVLLEPFHGDDARFNTYYGTSRDGELYEIVMEVSRDDGTIIGLKEYRNISASTRPGSSPSSPHPPAVGMSPHPHHLISLYATGSDGRVHQTFYDRHSGASKIDHPWTPWQTLPGGVQADSAPCVLNTPDGSLALAFVTASDGEVYQSILARGSGSSWAPWKSLHMAHVRGGPATMNSADGTYLSVFAIGATGQAVESTYLRGPGSRWVQKMLPDGPHLTGTPACFAASDSSLESVLALGVDGVVHQTIRSPHPNNPWSAWAALPANVKLSAGPSVLDAYNRNSLSVVAVDTSGQLVRCRYVRGAARGATDHWTNWEPVPMWTGAPRWKGVSQITTPATTESPDSYRELFFGADRSLRNYFYEASRGKFTIREAGVVGWLCPTSALGMPSNVDITTYDFVHDSDKYGISLEQKSAWVIRAAEVIGGFKYSNYDHGNSGRVTLDDLAIVWVYAGGDSGRARGVDPAVVKVPSLTGGVSQEHGLPRFGPALSLRLAAEEVAHAMFNITDLYDSGGTLNPLTEPRGLAITGTGGESPHPSPWDKMKLGWCTIKVAKQSAWYELPAVEQTNEILILPTSAPTEYFILENRYPPGSFEDGFKGAGLAVWHIVEDWPNGSAQWGRDTIRLLHCQPPVAGASNGETFLWDGGHPNQSYDITDSSTPANLQLSNGTWSGLRIHSISAKGPKMRFRVAVP